MRRTTIMTAGLLCALAATVSQADEKSNQDLVRQYVDGVWNLGNFALIDQLTAPDFFRSGPTSETSTPNKEEYKAYVKLVRSSYEGFKVQIDEISAKGNNVYLRWTVKGKFTGNEHLPATNKTIEIKGTSIITFENNKIAHENVSWDMLDWYRQVGIEPTVTPRDQSILLVRRAITELYNKGNTAAVDEFFAENYVGHSMTGKEDIRDREVLKQNLTKIRTSFPDVYLTLDEVLFDQGNVVARWTGKATHKGDFEGIPASNKPVTVRGITMYRVADGKIAETWAVWDSASLMRQIGAMPASPTRPAAK